MSAPWSGGGDAVGGKLAPVQRVLLLIFLLVLPIAALSAACEGCRAPLSKAPKAQEGPATVRLFLLSDVAGALEPCGCVKDQLGGMDHLGALVAGDKDGAKATRVLASGPLFFLDMQLSDEKRAQEITK